MNLHVSTSGNFSLGTKLPFSYIIDVHQCFNALFSISDGTTTSYIVSRNGYISHLTKDLSFDKNLRKNV